MQIEPATKSTIDDDDLFGEEFDNLANRELVPLSDTSNLLTPIQILDSVISFSPFFFLKSLAVAAKLSLSLKVWAEADKDLSTAHNL